MMSISTAGCPSNGNPSADRPQQSPALARRCPLPHRQRYPPRQPTPPKTSPFVSPIRFVRIEINPRPRLFDLVPLVLLKPVTEPEPAVHHSQTSDSILIRRAIRGTSAGSAFKSRFHCSRVMLKPFCLQSKGEDRIVLPPHRTTPAEARTPQSSESMTSQAHGSTAEREQQQHHRRRCGCPGNDRRTP